MSTLVHWCCIENSQLSSVQKMKLLLIVFIEVSQVLTTDLYSSNSVGSCIRLCLFWSAPCFNIFVILQWPFYKSWTIGNANKKLCSKQVVDAVIKWHSDASTTCLPLWYKCTNAMMNFKILFTIFWCIFKHSTVHVY